MAKIPDQGDEILTPLDAHVLCWSHTSKWIRSSWFLLRFFSLGNGSLCCFPSWQASHIWPFRPLYFGTLETTCSDCIFSSFRKLMWPTRLCHRSMSNPTFCPFANIVVPTSLVSRINIYLSWRPCAMTLPSSLMKHPICVNC